MRMVFPCEPYSKLENTLNHLVILILLENVSIFSFVTWHIMLCAPKGSKLIIANSLTFSCHCCLAELDKGWVHLLEIYIEGIESVVHFPSLNFYTHMRMRVHT